MGAVLKLFVCDNYRAEVEAIIRTEGWQDVEIGTFQRMCGHPQQKIPPVHARLKELQNKADTVVINCQRMQPDLAADNFYQLPQCFNMLVNQSLVEDALRRGVYILTPNWLANWKKHLEEWGLDQETARQFFKESMSSLLLLDTGLDNHNSRHLIDLSAYLDMAAQSIPVGLDFLRLYLNQIVYSWRQKNTLEKIEAMNAEANRITADYAMVIDLLTRLTQIYSEEEAHSEVSDLFSMLFSAEKVIYYPLKNGNLLQIQSHSLLPDEQENLQGWLKNSTESFTYTPSGAGFYLRIEHMDQALGVLVANNLTLPRYMVQYLNLSLMIAKLCGLSISNAQNYQKLQEAEITARKEREIAETLRTTMSELASELSLEDLLGNILVSLNRVIPFYEALIYLKQADSFYFKSGLRVNSSDSFESHKPSEKYMVIDATWLNAEPMTLADIEHTPKIRSYINPNTICSWIGLPLTQHGKIIGFLSISSKEKDIYNDKTVILAQAFGAEVSITLENARLFTELTEAAITDSLTGLFNRRRFYELANTEFSRSQRYRRPLTAIMMDIDYFKKVNDTYGHLVGDQVLIWLADLCMQNARSADIVGRYGGEEFVMLLPETDQENARIFAERLRALIANNSFPTSKGKLQITCSLGVASLSENSTSLEELLDQGDIALYKAKKSGRNRVCYWKEPEAK